MKRILLAASLVLMTGLAAKAQRYCVIDSKYILEKVPDYNNAQKQLDAASQGWQKEVDAKMQNIDQMYKSYQAERPMLSEDARKKREDEIVAKEKEAKDVANWVCDILEDLKNPATIEKIRKQVVALCDQFPVYFPPRAPSIA